jgi:cytochrome c oxidase subunit 2
VSRRHRGSFAKLRTTVSVALLAATVAACRGALNQSALEPAGPQAENVFHLWSFALTVAAAVYALTIGALVWATWRARRRERAGDPAPADGERRMTMGVSLAVGASVVTLLVFLGYDLAVGRTTTGAPTRHPITIEVTGHQWWWELTYADTGAHARFTTANELHVPVGRPVVLVLNADDVIHSFWVPNLAGKKDLVPGRTQTFWFQADTPGVYRGQCAEFCGYQHAKMGLVVVAEPPAQYAAWAVASQATPPPPSDPTAARGQQVFLNGPCAMCHAIQGTSAQSHAGPDLTRVGSRQTIAAGALRNTRGNLAGWIVDPQRVKPGAHMPPNQLAPPDLDALLTYLQTLK